MYNSCEEIRQRHRRSKKMTMNTASLSTMPTWQQGLIITAIAVGLILLFGYLWYEHIHKAGRLD